MTDQTAPSSLARLGTVFHRSKRMTFSEYRQWRREQVERRAACDSFARYASEFIQEDEPRFLATFAHDGNSHVINAFGRPERWQFDVIFEFLAARGLVRGSALDIGANLGLHSIFLAQQYDRVLALEPHPNTFQLLAYNLATYAPNASAHRLAAYSENGTAELNDGKPGNIGGANLSVRNERSGRYPVETIRLDDWDGLQDQDVGFMKIDVENAEHSVLLGAVETIRRHRPVILMEDWLSNNGNTSDAVKLLMSLGYDTILEPVFYSKRWRGGSMRSVSRLAHFLDLFLHGHSFALRQCTYNNPRGYDLILALHGRHDPSDH
ncbi:MAG: FkbM family methyltransferase [Rhodospirillales bacterium]